MDTIKQNLGWFVVIAAFLIFGTAFAINAQRSDNTKTVDTKTTNKEVTDSETVKDVASAATPNKTVATNDSAQSSAKPYNYTAQQGDSYSVLARKAVQTYGIINKVTLTSAQIIAAETNLTINAGSPFLDQGQSVKFDVTTLKTALEAAQKISAEDAAAWEIYVPTVNYNTNAYGQTT